MDKSNNNLIEQMEKMEIMRQDSEEMSSTTPVTPLSDFVTTSETLEDDLEGGKAFAFLVVVGMCQKTVETQEGVQIEVASYLIRKHI